MKALFKFYWDCGRMGDLDGLFVANKEEVKKAIGKDIYFGEVLGKHSEIEGTLEKGDFEMITDDPNVVRVFEEHSIYSGHNPLDYLEDQP